MRARRILTADAETQTYGCDVDGVPVVSGARFATPARGPCGFELQTKPDPAFPSLESSVEAEDELPDADLPIAESVYGLQSLQVASV
jgi:hypothetical protein